MIRSWTERLLGGVAGGLAQTLPLSAWVWRLLWILLTLLTGGFGALIYLLWWWLLPLDLPGERPTRFFPTVLALLSAALIVGGYVLRAQLVSATGADLYIPLLLTLVAGVFFLRQVALRGSAVIALVLLVLAGLSLATALGALPPGVDDILARATGGWLVFLGLALLLRDRVPFGAFAALIVSLALVGGVTLVAYSSRLNDQRTENIVENTFELDNAVTTLQINLTTLETDVRVQSAAPGARTITFEYIGSRASAIIQDFTTEGALATLTLSETRSQGIPTLENIGRATVLVTLPQEIAIAMAFRGANGEAALDLGEVQLERLNMDLERGNAVVTFPVYQPISPSVLQSPGELIVRDGTLRLIAAPEIGGQFVMNKATNQRPLFDDLVYALEDNLNEWLLVARQYDNTAASITYLLTVPRAQVRLDTAVSQ